MCFKIEPFFPVFCARFLYSANKLAFRVLLQYPNSRMQAGPSKDNENTTVSAFHTKLESCRIASPPIPVPVVYLIKFKTRQLQDLMDKAIEVVQSDHSRLMLNIQGAVELSNDTLDSQQTLWQFEAHFLRWFQHLSKDSFECLKKYNDTSAVAIKQKSPQD